MYRTPKRQEGEKSDRPGKPPVRNSFGKPDSTAQGTVSTSPSTSGTKQLAPLSKDKTFTLPQKQQVTKSPKQSGGSSGATPPKRRYTGRVTEALEHLEKGMKSIESSRNTKTEIREEVKRTMVCLATLVEDAEEEIRGLYEKLEEKKKTESQPAAVSDTVSTQRFESGIYDVLTILEKHTQLLLENTNTLEQTKELTEIVLENIPSEEERRTYAGVAGTGTLRALKRNTVHSVVVTSADETDSSEEVLRQVQEAVGTEEGWIHVEKVRKAKKQKLIVGMGTKEDRTLFKEKLEKRASHLKVEEVENKNPLMVVRDVLNMHSDQEFLDALTNQNEELFYGLEKEHATVQYRRRARNPLTSHFVVSVHPEIWKKAMTIGHAYIGMQRVRVQDQSPLVQCSRCLGYGHGKRFCKEAEDSCSHCDGHHMRTECPEWHAGHPPSCRNCKAARLAQTDHNTFSSTCPIRAKWDRLARSKIAYC